MNHLHWIQHENKDLLKNEAHTLIELSVVIGGISHFSIHDKDFVVQQNGFWNPVYFVLQNSVAILKLSHGLWGSKGTLDFQDGTTFSSEYISNGGFKIRFLDGNNELLSYGIIIKENQTLMDFQVGVTMMDAEKFLLLAALGRVVFANLFPQITSEDESTLTLLFDSL